LIAAPGAGFAPGGFLGKGGQGAFGKPEGDAFHFKQLLKLLDQGVFWLLQNSNQGTFI
jgi:hypothetical protein